MRRRINSLLLFLGKACKVLALLICKDGGEYNKVVDLVAEVSCLMSQVKSFIAANSGGLPLSEVVANASSCSSVVLHSIYKKSNDVVVEPCDGFKGVSVI